MPIRMRYKDPLTEEYLDVDVYHFYTDKETLDCFVVCWVISKEYWCTVPIFTLTPIQKKETLRG